MSPGRRRGRRRASGSAASSPASRSRRRSTRRGTSGSRCAAPSDRTLLIGGHIDSVPNGGWLDGCLNVMAGVEVLRRIAEDGEPPLTVRLVNWADEEGARFGRWLFGSSAASGSMADQDEFREADRPGRDRARRTRSRAHGVDLDRATDARAQLTTPPPIWSCTSSRGRCWSRSTCRSASSSAPSASSATRSPSRARRRTPARRRWTGAATPSPAPPGWRPVIREIAAETGDGGVCTSGNVVYRAGDRHLGRRERRAAARPAPPRRRKLAACSTPRRRRRALRRRGEHRGLLGTDLGDRADPVRRDADRPRRRGDRRGRGPVAPAAERPAARRRRGRPHGGADRDGLRPEPSRPLAYEARGHEGGAPGAFGPGARPADLEGARALHDSALTELVRLSQVALRWARHSLGDANTPGLLHSLLPAPSIGRRGPRSPVDSAAAAADRFRGLCSPPRAELRRHDPPRPTLAAARRADAAGGEERVRVRLDVRLARALAGAVPAPDSRGDEHGAAEARPERDEPGHPRADRDRERVRHAPGRLRWPDGDGHRPRRLRTPRDRPAAGEGRRVRGRVPDAARPDEWARGAMERHRHRARMGEGPDGDPALRRRVRAAGARDRRPRRRRRDHPARRPGDRRVDRRPGARGGRGGRPRPVGDEGGRLRAGARRRRPRRRMRAGALVPRDGLEPRLRRASRSTTRPTSRRR